MRINTEKNQMLEFKISMLFLLFLAVCCKNNARVEQQNPTTENKTPKDSLSTKKSVAQIKGYHDDFVNILSLSDDFILDLKYASADNFLKQAVYDCPECFLRKATAKALLAAHESFKKLGYRIKIFDCYRPLSVQQKMWDILPGTHYVANPAKGSKHNRGAAVDITLVDSHGNELDMGTAFDHFGKEAHHSYPHLPTEVIKNRNLLKTVMDKHNFRSIYSEWWHYEFRPERNSKIENFTWECL